MKVNLRMNLSHFLNKAIEESVIDKLERLARLIYGVDEYNEDADFVSKIMEDLIESPHHRITKLEIEKCNNLYKQYKELK